MAISIKFKCFIFQFFFNLGIKIVKLIYFI